MFAPYDWFRIMRYGGIIVSLEMLKIALFGFLHAACHASFESSIPSSPPSLCLNAAHVANNAILPA